MYSLTRPYRPLSSIFRRLALDNAVNADDVHLPSERPTCKAALHGMHGAAATIAYDPRITALCIRQ